MAEIIKLGSNGNWGVKPNGVLAYNDENNVFKAIELQSSRASGATYVGEDGLIKDAEVGVPRIDWTNGVGELLLEPSRTNSITQSEYVDSWSVKTNISVVSNDGVSPEGVNNASNIYPTTTGVCFFYEGSITYTSGTTYTYSVFAKANGKDYLQITTSGASFSNQYCTFDLSNGTKDNNGFEDAGIKDYGNGWYRCYVVETSISTASSRFVIGLVGNASAGRLASVTADGTNGVLVYGVVSEAGSYPTSYIRTDGSSVTRIADAVTGNSSLGQVINSSEGTLYFNFRTLTQIPSASNYVSLSNGTTSDSVFFQFRNDGNLRIYHKALGGSDIAFIVAGNDYSSQYYKAAYTWNNSTNTSNLFVNGVKQTLNGGFVYTDISALDKLSLDLGTSGSDFRGRAREIKVYDTALTDAELTTLTTI